MIFKLDNSITSFPQTNISILAEMAFDVARNEHYFAVDDFRIKKWFYDNIIDNSSCFPPVFRDLIQRRTDLFGPTKMLQGVLRSANVGYLQPGMLSPADVVDLIKRDSCVALENALYDWSVYSKWIELYDNRNKATKTLSERLIDAIKKGKLIPLNAGGGNGSIVNVLRTYKQVAGRFFSLKSTTIFDSDKTSHSDVINHNASLIACLQSEGIEWHELSKREIENYFSYEEYEASGLINDKAFLNALTNIQWDYNDFSDDKGRYGVKMQKKDVLTLCEHLTYDRLQSRFGKGRDECIEIMNLLIKYI